MISTDAKVYEVLSLAMRYFFTLMGVMIVWRSFSWLRKDRKQKHRRLKQLPDAGTIGIFTVIQGGKQLKPGDVIPVPHEGVLGYVRTCDVVVPVEDVATVHLDFTFQDGKGLFIYPRRGCEAVVDGVPLASRRESSRNPMQHGSTLQIGQALLQLGVFAGLHVKEAHYAPFAPVDEYAADEAFLPDAPAYAPPQHPWQPAPYEPVNPPRYDQPPFAPMNGPYESPWQGGDNDAP